VAIAALPRFRTQAFIDGGFRDAASGATFETENPATGEVITSVAAGDAVDIDLAVQGARSRTGGGHAWPRPIARRCSSATPT
jgi:gamma-glutamyl-gamma-aminobutyraldehyde dehydrogenase